MKKTLLSVLLLLGILTQPAFAALITYTDVGPNTDYLEAINWMSDNGVIQGYPDQTFKPDMCVNRVELLKMLYLTNETDLTDASIGATWAGYFPDVNEGSWYWTYLRYALGTGTVQGYPDKTFKPEQCVKRVEAIKMATLEFNGGQIPQGLGYAGISLLVDSYVDIDHNGWYYPYFVYTIAANVLGLKHVVTQPNPDSPYYGIDQYYGPGGDMARKEVAEMLYRMKAIKDNGVEKYNNEVPNPIP